jgi:hypothetical protein
VNMKDRVSTATSGSSISLPLMCASSLKTLNSGVAVMVEMVGCGGEG